MYARTDRAYPWAESIIIFIAGFLAYELKRQFGLFAHQVFHIRQNGPEPWLGFGAHEIFSLATVLFALVIYQHTNLPNAPWLERRLYGGRATEKKIRIWRPALLATVLTLAIALALSVVSAHLGHPDKLFSTLKGPSLPHDVQVKLWTMYPLAVVGAPIDEEIFYRFGLVSVIVWLLLQLKRDANPRGLLLLWLPIVIVGIYFGYAHVAENLETVQTGNIYLSILIAPQTWAGIIFGYVFCTYGLEAAIVTHFVTDACAPFVLGIFSSLMHLAH
jgi:hypothetical protein